MALIAALAVAAAAAIAQPGHYLITDYGAVADGATLNTSAIQRAVDAAAAAGRCV